MNKLKTIDEVCGNPPGTFISSLEKLATTPEPPKRNIQSSLAWTLEINEWEKRYDIKYEDYLRRDL